MSIGQIQHASPPKRERVSYNDQAMGIPKGRMRLPVAKQLLSAYERNGYNASAAAKEVGYTKLQAEANGYKSVQIAAKRVASELANDREPMSRGEVIGIIESLGLTRDVVVAEYLKLVNQDQDRAVKLKALQPLMPDIHSSFKEDAPKAMAPVSITIKETGSEKTLETQGSIDRVAQSTFSDPITPTDIQGVIE